MKEIWIPIVGYVESRCYEVSNLGRVRGYLFKQWGHGSLGLCILKQTDNTRYRRVSLQTDDGYYKAVHVHTLVCIAFHGKRPKGCEVNHKDLDKHNNPESNLERSTKLGNSKHFYENGYHSEMHHNAKLTALQVMMIRALYRGYRGQRKLLAERFGVSKHTIDNVTTGDNWNYL